MRDYQHFLFFASVISGHTATLDADEARHAIKVLRLTDGDRFQVTCGDGHIYICKLLGSDKENATGTIVDKISVPPLHPSIHCYIGLPDKDAFESVVTDLTAMGVSQITPLITENCQKNWWEQKWEKHYERFNSKMIAAMKQSLYPRIPVLHPPTPVERILTTIENCAIVADYDGVSLSDCQLSSEIHVSCIVGPPGGFSTHEINQFRERGFYFVKCGATRLRTELAAVVMCGGIRR